MNFLKEGLTNIGRRAKYNIDGLIFIVIIHNFKISYGVLRYQIMPLEGSGRKWVNSDSITIKNNEI